ncbi:MAG TPA: lysophospholipid acyltransferase family protein [Gammaproteobacteria bacterium]|nr:lysophospholipid acyltransferase family protein [Gammaproteobacteria bacterium]
METRLGRWYRTLGTSFCYVAFGLGCLVAAPTVLPVLCLLPGSRAARRRRIRHFVSGSFRALLWLAARLGIGRVEVEGREWLEQAGGRLVLATHPTYLDAVVLLSLMPNADCVVKSALWRNPFIYLFVCLAEYISNAAPEALIDDCIRAVRTGEALLVFPEGTRSVPGADLKFKRGAAQIAVRGDLEILPVVLHCSPPTLQKDKLWYEVPERPWCLTVKFCAPRKLQEFVPPQPRPVGVTVRHLNRALETFFKQQLPDHEYAR